MIFSGGNNGASPLQPDTTSAERKDLTREGSSIHFSSPAAAASSILSAISMNHFEVTDLGRISMYDHVT